MSLCPPLHQDTPRKRIACGRLCSPLGPSFKSWRRSWSSRRLSGSNSWKTCRRSRKSSRISKRRGYPSRKRTPGRWGLDKEWPHFPCRRNIDKAVTSSFGNLSFFFTIPASLVTWSKRKTLIWAKRIFFPRSREMKYCYKRVYLSETGRSLSPHLPLDTGHHFLHNCKL